MADLAHLDRASAITTVTGKLQRFDLIAAADRRAQTYSGGMKQRLDLAMTLITRPQLIFLDEATAGARSGSRRATRATDAVVRRRAVGGTGRTSFARDLAAKKSPNTCRPRSNDSKALWLTHTSCYDATSDGGTKKI